MEQESMIFYRSFYEALRDLDDDIRLELYDAIMRYSLYEEDVEVSPAVKPFFRLISPQLDANLRRRKNGVYGVLGGRPRKNKPNGLLEEKPTGLSNSKPNGLQNKNPNKNVSKNVNKNVNNIKGKFTDYEQSKTNYSDLEKKIYAN